MNTKAPSNVLIARSAPRALVIRRGPSKHVQLLGWNLDTDESFSVTSMMLQQMHIRARRMSLPMLLYRAAEFSSKS